MPNPFDPAVNPFTTGLQGSQTPASTSNAVAQRKVVGPKPTASPWDSFGAAGDAWNTVNVAARQKALSGYLQPSGSGAPAQPFVTALSSPAGPAGPGTPAAGTPGPFAPSGPAGGPGAPNTPSAPGLTGGTPVTPPTTGIGSGVNGNALFLSGATTPLSAGIHAITSGTGNVENPVVPSSRGRIVGKPTPAEEAWQALLAQSPGLAQHPELQQQYIDWANQNGVNDPSKIVNPIDWLNSTQGNMVRSDPALWGLYAAGLGSHGDSYYFNSDGTTRAWANNTTAPNMADPAEAFTSYQQSAPGFFAPSLTTAQGAALVNQYRSNPNGLNITDWMARYYPQYLDSKGVPVDSAAVEGPGGPGTRGTVLRDYHYYLGRSDPGAVDNAPKTLGLPDPTNPANPAAVVPKVGGATPTGGPETSTPGGTPGPGGTPAVVTKPVDTTGATAKGGPPVTSTTPPVTPGGPSTGTPTGTVTPPTTPTPTATTTPPTTTTATNPADPAILSQYLTGLMQPGWTQAANDLQRQNLSAEALTGQTNSGGNAATNANAQARLSADNQGKLADMLSTASEGEKNRINAMAIAQLQSQTQKYGIDAQTATAEMQNETTRLGITTNDALQRWLNDPNNNTLQKYGIDQNVLLAHYQAEMQAQNASMAANAQVNAAALTAAMNKTIADMNNATALSNAQKQYDLGVLGLNEDVYKTNSAQYTAMLQFLMLLSPEQRASLGALGQLPGNIVVPGP